MAKANPPRDVVEVRIRIAARPTTVFRFLSDPERFRAWMGPTSDIAPAAGGALRVPYPDGNVARGVVQEIVPNRQIVFTWGYENGANGVAEGASRVSVELTPTDSGTLVTLRHEGLPTDAHRGGHLMGWRYALAQLAAASATEQLASRTEGAVDTYVAAWAETDAAKRLVLLDRCWTEDGVFRDAMGYAEGRGSLDEYIATAQMLAPNVRLERASPVARTDAHLWYRWRLVTPAGDAVGHGVNVARITPDGQLQSTIGFWSGAEPA